MAEDQTTVRAVTIPTDPTAPVSVETIDVSPAALTRAVGGMLQMLTLPGAQALVWCNERGRLLGLEPNPRATRLVEHYLPGFAKADMITGPVVVVGLDPDGQDADVPADVEAAATTA